MAAVSLALRIVALALSVAAAVVMATASQLLYHLGPVVSSRAVVYFVVASAISAVCAALALYLSMHDADDGTGPRCLSAYDDGTRELAVSVVDAVAQALLFSAAGAVIALRGGIVCVGPASTFCGKVGIAAAIGVCAAVSTAVAALTRDAGGSARRDGC